MSATNKKSSVFEKEERLAGGYGAYAAKQNPEMLLRRSVMACLLWEDIAYASGETAAEQIAKLVPLVNPETVAAIAVEARQVQKLRHVPLLIVREMARHASHRPFVRKTLNEIILRPDEMAEFLSLYWKEGKRPLASAVKRGLADVFCKFDEYQLAKWNRQNEIKLRDVLFMVHAKPKDTWQEAVWKRLVDNELTTPDTWEVGISAAKTADEKKYVWERLIAENRLGALATLRNISNMQEVGVPRETISYAIESANPAMLLPINFWSAAKAAPDFTRQLETLMFRCATQWPKIAGWTILVVDISGSMGAAISGKSTNTRLDVAASMAVLAAEVCENIIIYVTSGNDSTRIHKTEKFKPYRGFMLADQLRSAELGGGGIFTRQCLEYIKSVESEQPDRIIVFSDSQDCDHCNRRVPSPFGKRNYIVDISCEKHGVNYNNIWDAEISGWSEHFLRFIAELES